VVIIPKTAAASDNSLIGIVKYTYSGYVLECPHHGIIYRSRQYWYGNPEPESVVRTELKHIWPGQQNNVGTSHNLSRKIIDNVSYVSEAISSVSSKPTMLAKQWMADRVAPAYWVPNADISECHACRRPFAHVLDKKHHCRGCGRGFCDRCSAKRRIIPWWSLSDRVRVCDACHDKPEIDEPQVAFTSQLVGGSSVGGSRSSPPPPPPRATTSQAHMATGGAYESGAANNDVMVRKVTETVQETISMIGYATKYPLDMLKESARPSYWKPDSECGKCALCASAFGDLLPLHHCRSCGNGVCAACSPHLRPVPARGWETPVRVCNNCVTLTDLPEAK
jgi:zinc finger FYVE domain-containing protein 1